MSIRVRLEDFEVAEGICLTSRCSVRAQIQALSYRMGEAAGSRRRLPVLDGGAAQPAKMDGGVIDTRATPLNNCVTGPTEDLGCLEPRQSR